MAKIVILNFKFYLIISAEGREEGIKQGEQKGKLESKREIAKKLKKKHIPIDEIIEITELSREEIRNL